MNEIENEIYVNAYRRVIQIPYQWDKDPHISVIDKSVSQEKLIAHIIRYLERKKNPWVKNITLPDLETEWIIFSYASGGIFDYETSVLRKQEIKIKRKYGEYVYNVKEIEQPFRLFSKMITLDMVIRYGMTKK